MKIEYKKAVMRTKNAEVSDFLVEDTESDKIHAEKIADALKRLDGVEVVITNSLSGRGCIIAGYPKEASERMKNLTYAVEQDEIFGSYFDDWDSFSKVWEKGEYDPGGVWTIENKFFEIIPKEDK